MNYLLRCPELDVSIVVAKGDPIAWFLQRVIAKGGTLVCERIEE